MIAIIDVTLQLPGLSGVTLQLHLKSFQIKTSIAF